MKGDSQKGGGEKDRYLLGFKVHANSAADDEQVDRGSFSRGQFGVSQRRPFPDMNFRQSRRKVGILVAGWKFLWSERVFRGTGIGRNFREKCCPKRRRPSSEDLKRSLPDGRSRYRSPVEVETPLQKKRIFGKMKRGRKLVWKRY